MPPKSDHTSSNGSGAPKGTPVASQRIWSEHCAKELKSQVVRTEFAPHVHGSNLLPDKPTDLSRELALREDHAAVTQRAQAMAELAAKDPVAHAQVTSRLERHTLGPRDKASFPQTSAQEIGWEMNSMHQTEAAPYARPHTNGDVTSYADRYMESHGYNCFSTSQFKYHPRSTTQKK